MTRRYIETGLTYPSILYLDPPDNPVRGDFYWDEKRSCILWFLDGWVEVR